MQQEIESFLTGFSNTLAQYMGKNYENQIAQQQQKQKQAGALQLAGAKAELDLAKDSALKLYEQTLAGKVDPETASSIHPQAASLVENFNKQNKRYPTVNEAKDLFGKLESGDQKQANREQRLNTAILQYTEALEKNPVHRKMQEQGLALGQLDEVAQLAKEGNTVASSAMGIKMARAMGEVGVLTESDITRYVESRQLPRKAADKLSRWIKGRPTEATIEEIQQIGNVLRDSFNNKVTPIYDRYINRLSSNMGISKEEAAKRLDVPYSGRIKGELPNQPKKTSGPANGSIGTTSKGTSYKILQ